MQEPNPDRQPNLFYLAFFNQRELRAGWRALIAVALFYFVSAVLFYLFRAFLMGFAPSALILREAVVLAAVILVSWIMSKFERRPMGEYGLPLGHARLVPRFILGYIFWGFLPLSVLLLVLRAMHSFYFGQVALHGSQAFYWAALWGLFFCLVGLCEEYLLRGYLLYTLADGIGFWPAAVVLAALFALGHTLNGGETRIGILMTAFFAIFASVILRYTGNLWLAVGAHAGWDWGQSYFYGVGDSGIQFQGHLLNPHTQGPEWISGGTTGPEGSILCLVLMVALSVLFVLFYRTPSETASPY